MPHDLMGWMEIADAAAMALLVARLLFEKLSHVYLALYLHAFIESLLEILTVGGVFNHRAAYALMYVTTTPLRWILWALIVRNLYQSALAPYPGLASAGRRVLKIALYVGATLIALTLAFDFLYWAPGNRVLPFLFLFDRTITALLALIILALCGFLAWFLVPTRRNIAYLCMGFGIIFAIRSPAHFATNALGPTATSTANFVTVASSMSVFLAWALLLNRVGEEKTAFVGRRPSPREIELAMQKLSAVNRQLGGGGGD